MIAGPQNQAVPAYMQTKTVMQAPEGVDEQFSRAAQVYDPNKGDKVDYYGHFDMGEKPPIRPYTGVGGDLAGVYGDPSGKMLPGMSGPGLGQGATGSENAVPANGAIPAGAPVARNNLGRMALIGAAVIGGLFLLRKVA